MRTNRIGRMLAFCFALLIAFSAVRCSVVSASATALPADNWAEGSITATLDTGEQEAGSVTVQAYKLVSVHTGALQGTDPAAYQPQLPEYTWESGIAGWIRANYPNYIGKGSDNSVQEVFSTENTKITAAELAEFYGKIEAAIMKNNSPIHDLPTKSATASDDRTASISGLTMGVYLVTATGGTAVYRPTVAMITPEESNGSWTITENAQVTLKGSPVSLVKTITGVTGSAGAAVSDDHKRAVAGIGDTVSYKLEVDVPEYPSQSVARAFIIKDTLPEWLTLTQGTIKVKMSDGTELQNLSDRIRVEGQVLTIDLTPDANKTIQNPIDGKRKLLVTYDAKLNAKATLGEAGNVSTASLTYSNNPYNEASAKIVDDIATVYTFGIEVTKVQKGTTNPLSGAQFELKDAGSIPIKFSDGYVKSADGAATPTTGTDGKLTLKGLAPGTYKLKETKAPAGYVLSAAETEITIADTNFNGIPDSKEQPTTDTTTTDTTTTDTTTTQTTEKDKDNGLVSITVENTKGFTLPRTGGIGTVLFSMIGIVLMGSGVLLVAVFLRKRFGKSR